MIPVDPANMREVGIAPGVAFIAFVSLIALISLVAFIPLISLRTGRTRFAFAAGSSAVIEDALDDLLQQASAREILRSVQLSIRGRPSQTSRRHNP